MSKQLTLSATLAVLSMAALALSATLGHVGSAPESHAAANTAMIGFQATR